MSRQNIETWSRTKSENGRSPLMTAAAISLDWKNMEDIFKANKKAIYETDKAVTGLPVSLLAAVGPNSALEAVYHLCKENPSALIRQPSQFENEEDVDVRINRKRKF